MRTDMTKLIVAFRNFANAPKNNSGNPFVLNAAKIYHNTRRHSSENADVRISFQTSGGPEVQRPYSQHTETAA
jgi:hypothetical protein